MKKILLALLIVGCSIGVQGADEVTFEFSTGIQGPLKTKMEQQLSLFLTAINRAESAGSDEINYSGVQFETSETANQTVGTLWNSVHFRTQDDDFYETCLKHRGGGYQVRNIYMDMKPIDDSYQEDLSRELVIEFDSQGRIRDLNFAMGKLQYQELLKEGELLNDAERRLVIVKECENFMGAYNKMDMKYMEDIFSDDALIITGRVRQRVKSSITMRSSEVNLPQSQNVEYTVQTKKEYLNNLRRCFDNQRRKKGGYINVKFDDYKIVRHPAKPNYYGVTLKQSWHSQGYHDEGIVFLVWNFTDEDHPKIEVRTWQAMSTTEKEIFTLNNFKLR